MRLRSGAGDKETAAAAAENAMQETAVDISYTHYFAHDDGFRHPSQYSSSAADVGAALS